MKLAKPFAAMLAAGLLFTAACSADDPATPSQTQTSTTSQTDPAPDPTGAPEWTLPALPGLDVKYTCTETAVKVFADDGHVIFATLTLPDGDGPFPAVVMIHGFGSTKDEAGDGYKMMAPWLAQAGIASIRYDSIGTGESLVDHKEFTLAKAVEDTNAVAAYARTLPQVNDGKIGLLGWSQGGLVALLTASRNPSEYTAVVTWAAADPLEMYSILAGSSEEMAEAKANGFYPMRFDWREPLNIGYDEIVECAGVDLQSELRKSTAAILNINGSIDDTVDPANGAEFAGLSSNPLSTYQIIDGADHTFLIFTGDYTKFFDLATYTLKYFQKNL
jgi:dienelactone hydrolase